MNPLIRNPLFISGLVIRVVLLAIVTPTAVQYWYAPFLEHALTSFGFDPWTSFLTVGGEQRAFPYGYAMWLVFLPLTAFAHAVGMGAAVGYGITLVLVDLGMLQVLRNSSDSRLDRVLALYWLSPIVLFATYWLGLNDLWPILLLMVCLAALAKGAALRAGMCMALAISAKLSMLLAAPVLLIYLFQNKRLRLFFIPFSLALGLTLLALQVPYLASSGAREMLFGNPEMSKVYDISIPFGKELRVYLLPLAYILVLFWTWRIRRMSFDLLIALLGMCFFLVLMLTPASPGWFVWVLPFLVLYQVKSDRIAIMLVAGFSLLYIGLNGLLAPAPSVLGLHWPAGESPVTWLALSNQAISLWQTLLLATGLVIAARMLREGIQVNEFFRLSRRPFVLGIAGDSGAGKDTLADAIEGLFGRHSVTQISGDDYHLWDRNKPMWQVMTQLNPRANDLSRFTQDVQALARGKGVQSRHYDHHVGQMGRPASLKSNDFLIASGLHALYLPALRRLFDLRIFLDMDEGLRRRMKIDRDVKLRGHNRDRVEEAIGRREPDSIKYIRPQAAHADLILSLMPIAPNALEVSATVPRLKLEVSARQGLYDEALVRVLVGVCGLHVDLTHDAEDDRIEMLIEGDLAKDDVAFAASTLLPQLRELLDVSPEWHDGMLGLMQLIVVTYVAQSLHTRLL